MKSAKVIQIPKSGKDPTKPENYRPISLLSNIGKLKFNGARWRNPSVQLKIENSEIELSSHVTYLGVTLDDKLPFAEHIRTAQSKAMAALQSVYPLKIACQVNNKNLLYKNLIRPTMTYASSVWLIAANCHVQKLQTIQNKVLKTIHKLPMDFSTSRLHEITKYEKIKHQLEA